MEYSILNIELIKLSSGASPSWICIQSTEKNHNIDVNQCIYNQAMNNHSQYKKDDHAWLWGLAIFDISKWIDDMGDVNLFCFKVGL